ncbi:efflux RND transporter permease subunit [Candidatus Gracilibacteria bacterium]|nr:efflux RND transporter permease subunit [Candidatus Gracilibacteria bacterium]
MMKNKAEVSLKGIWTLLLDRFKVTTLIVLFILFYGTASFIGLPREVTPTIEIPAATITTIWPGASPGDVEKLVTNKIEKEIKTLDDVDKYNSVSMSGVSVISVEFDIDTDQNRNLQKLREKLDTAEKDLPKTIVDDPELNEISISDVPILSLTLSGDFSWSELKRFAEILEDEFESVPKVKEASVKGAPEDEMHILIDPIKMESKNIGLNEVITAIRNAHRDMPLGQVSVGAQKVEVTVRSEFETASEFMEMPIRESNGVLIKLGDFAEVRREFEKFEVETYFSTSSVSQPAVLIDVIKSASKGNVIEMVSDILGRVETLKLNGDLPQHLNVDVTYNRANDIQKSLDTLTGSGKSTLVLIALVMLIALGWRESLLAAISIPLSLLIAIIFLYVTGKTFNGISLFALVLSVGLLVDNSIIIVEGLSSGIHDKKQKPREAALSAIKTFRWPIITGTLTTIFAFLPMLFFVSGVSGEYISVLPITVTTVLVGALFVSLFLLPALGSKFYELIPPQKHRETVLLNKIQKWYEKTMHKILKSKKKLTLTIVGTLGAFLFSVGLVVTGAVPIEIFPSTDQTYFTAKFELPKGSRLEETRKLVEPMEDKLREFFLPQENGDIWLKNFVFTVGQQSSAVTDHDNVSSLPEENILGLTINLTDTDERQGKSYNILPIIRSQVAELVPPHIDLRFSEVEEGPPTGAPVEVRLIGEDLDHLEDLSEQLSKKFVQKEEMTNVRDSKADRVTQLTWKFDRDILQKFGLNPVGVMESLRTSVNGLTILKLTEGDEEIDVDIRVDWEGDRQWDDPQSLDYLNRIPLKTPGGKFVTLAQVATPELSSEMSRVEHRDGMRTLFVRADLKTGVAASQLKKFIDTSIQELDKRPGEIIEVGGENEEGNRLMREMSQAMMAALLLIFLVLVWQFNSFTQPLAILLLIPLSLTAVFLGFWLTGMMITFPTMIGIVALAGIIVNDAIVLIDQINHNLNLGQDAVTSYIEAGKDRLQPIFLTSITTVVGLIPLSFSDEMWGGLGFAIVYGMMLSTVLTLLLIPCFLLAIRRGRQWCTDYFFRSLKLLINR